VHLRVDKLKSYIFRVHWDDPVTVRLSGGLSVFSSPPPGSGSVLGAILKVMDLFDLDEHKAEDPLTFHRFFPPSLSLIYSGRHFMGLDYNKPIKRMNTITKYILYSKYGIKRHWDLFNLCQFDPINQMIPLSSAHCLSFGMQCQLSKSKYTSFKIFFYEKDSEPRLRSVDQHCRVDIFNNDAH
jgi:hypothetical protein